MFIDFFYLNYMLEKGGLILIDDINLYSVRELAKLLALQPTSFRLVGRLPSADKCLIFEKVTDRRRLPDWLDLPYVRAKTEAVKARTGKDELDEALARLQG